MTDNRGMSGDVLLKVHRTLCLAAAWEATAAGLAALLHRAWISVVVSAVVSVWMVWRVRSLVRAPRVVASSVPTVERERR